MAQEQSKNQPQGNEKPKAATPEQIGVATTSVAAILAAFVPTEQARIIRAAAAINGLEQGGKR